MPDYTTSRKFGSEISQFPARGCEIWRVFQGVGGYTLRKPHVATLPMAWHTQHHKHTTCQVSCLTLGQSFTFSSEDLFVDNRDILFLHEVPFWGCTRCAYCAHSKFGSDGMGSWHTITISWALAHHTTTCGTKYPAILSCSGPEPSIARTTDHIPQIPRLVSIESDYFTQREE